MRVDLVAPSQHGSLVELLCELHAYYHAGSSTPRAAVRSHLVENLLGPESPLRLVVASQDDGRVVGRALMAWVARYAVDHGCHRIDWPVQAGNARGIAFYERLGARRVVERLGYRLSEPAVGALAEASAAAGRAG